MDSTKKLEHVAIIMDGNRTWAKKNALAKMIGHTEGAKNVKRIVKAAIAQDIKFLTMYALSTENLKNRSESELNHLFNLFAKLINYKKLFRDNNVKLGVIGDTTGLPDKVKDVIEEMLSETADNDGLLFTLAINYGGRDEIIRAIKKLISAGETPSEETLSKHLDTAGIPDVDLLIRTGGFQRTSNYLPWQGIYAELYFTETHWPAFSATDLEEAIKWFWEQEKKRGK
jgi:undecaprenyl diphosphate synthase